MMPKIQKALYATTIAVLLCPLVMGRMSQAAPARKPPISKPGLKSGGKKSAGKKPQPGRMVIPIQTPAAITKGTPKSLPPWARVQKTNLFGAVGAVYGPPGTTNVALRKRVTSSDERPIIGSPELVTDGSKTGLDGDWVELAFGKQWVQIDLGKPCTLYAIALWHYIGEMRIYKDVVVQVADDPDFIKNVRTLYNNDATNASGLGLGKNLHYVESHRGKIIPVNGVKARYVRLYSNGNSSDDSNHYVEVEVWGK